MTISYSDNYFKILLYWRGSAWKAVWKELLLWLILYYAIKAILETCVPLDKTEEVRKILAIFDAYTGKVPLQFLLGFYVGQVLTRWWSQVMKVPWPDASMAWVCSIYPENDKDTRLRRHLVARYLVLSQTLVLRTVSTRIRKRFPTLELLVSAGLMTEEELQMYQQCPCPNMGWQLPIQWAIHGVMIPTTMRKEKPVHPAAVGVVINAINSFRSDLRELFIYDWICIPLVYTQTVSVVVYGYFAMCLIGHQSFGQQENIYVPVLTILQFIFFVGWFKVAQDLMRPFGEDDDDVELNYLLDRHLAVAFNFANWVPTAIPSLAEDRYFRAIEEYGNNREALNLAYTKIALTGAHDRPPKLHAGVEINAPEVDLAMSYKPPPYSRATTDSVYSESSQPSQGPTASIVKRALQKLRREHVKKEPVFF